MHSSAIEGDKPSGEIKEDASPKMPLVSIITPGKPVDTKLGTAPAGSSGTVVHAYNDGQACIIEFYEPFHALATVEADASAA